MSRYIRERPMVALWVAVVVTILGRLLDLRWHAAHDEFEGTSQQLEAHWLIWLGVLMVLAATVVAVRNGIGGAGLRLTLFSAALYVPVATWHFVEHANGADPELAHVLLAITHVGILAGAVIAVLEARRRAAPV